MNMVTLGIDLAKNVFALHGVDQHGQVVLNKPKVARGQLLEMVAQLPPCLSGMEACSGTRHWARQFNRFGHTAKLMAPKFAGNRGQTPISAETPISAADFRRFPPEYTGREMLRMVSHILRGPVYGQMDGWAILSLGLVPTSVFVTPSVQNHRPCAAFRARSGALQGWAA